MVLPHFLSAIDQLSAVYQLKIKYDQHKFGAVLFEAFNTIKSVVSFPLEDKNVVNEHHIIRKSHDTTHKKCLHVVHFNVPHNWFETTLLHQKCYYEDSKKFVGFTV